ncbi:hypothetical protein PFNF135_05186 [Plasmodium falciparum NF135/5.C10]|uniref:Uncharacterized protein n=1 Tax=Plasmodium falciparum NF135/5.C10 TaxID=1036726 RepID=W4IBD2_PLAFA|nr:hypothetical protein PFNF135_05186 [Plasmodium falciparum NF135/5.C10]
MLNNYFIILVLILILYFINYKKICYFKNRYLFDKNYECYYDIHVVYTHNNYCSTHLYLIYNKKKTRFCNYRFINLKYKIIKYVSVFIILCFINGKIWLQVRIFNSFNKT